jgi:hypothetical protein
MIWLHKASQIFDNQRVHALFAFALRTDPSDHIRLDETLRMIGRESLMKSAAWYIMQRDNVQKLFIG